MCSWMQFYNQLALTVGEIWRWKKLFKKHLRDKTVNYAAALQPEIAININGYIV